MSRQTTPTHPPASPLSAPRQSRERGLLGAAGLVGGLSVLASMLGFLRDLTIARYFGASADTDAFVVAWTIPETATPLLMEGAMAALLIPLFSHELARRGSFKESLGGVLLPLVGVLATLAGVTALAAPLLVAVLAPGLADPTTAVVSVRIAALTILFLGFSGYLMAALRASNIFGWPGSVYIAYNTGILAMIFLLHESLGILSAAIGLAVGGGCMIAVQIPVFIRRVGLPRPTLRIPRELVARLSVFVPLALYTLERHGQVFVERFVGSMLPVGTISHLNYATKVGQIPMLLSLTVALVTLPALSRSAAEGANERLRALVERNLRAVTFLIAPATAFLVVFAPEVVRLLFQRGAFTPADTAATADILRIYSLGLLGQVLVGVCVQALVAVPGRTWYPARAAMSGLLVTVGVTVVATPAFGALGLALANALGISVMALLLLRSLPRRGVRFGVRRTAVHFGRCVLAAALGGVAARLVGGVAGGLSAPSAEIGVPVVGGLALVLAYALLALVFNIAEARQLALALKVRFGCPRR